MALNEAVADFDCLVVKASAVEERDDLVKDVGGCYELWKADAKGAPMGNRGLVVLVVCQLKRQEIAGVQKYGFMPR